MKLVYTSNDWDDERPVAIFDLDGTISDDRHRMPYLKKAKETANLEMQAIRSDHVQSLFDTYHGLCQLDTLMVPGASLFEKYLKDRNFQTWIMTARPEKFSQATLDWLWAHFGEWPEKILMRPIGCTNPSWLIKRNMLIASKPFVEGGYHLFVDNSKEVIDRMSPYVSTFHFQLNPYHV
jgi:hypothetical protein